MFSPEPIPWIPVANQPTMKQHNGVVYTLAWHQQTQSCPDKPLGYSNHDHLQDLMMSPTHAILTLWSTTGVRIGANNDAFTLIWVHIHLLKSCSILLTTLTLVFIHVLHVYFFNISHRFYMASVYLLNHDGSRHGRGSSLGQQSQPPLSLPFFVWYMYYQNAFYLLNWLGMT